MLGVPPFTGSFFHQLDVSNTGGGVQFANWGNAIGNITVSTPVPVTVNGLSLGAQGDLTTAPGSDLTAVNWLDVFWSSEHRWHLQRASNVVLGRSRTNHSCGSSVQPH